MLAQFVGQYYLEREVPPEILVEHDFEDMQVFESTLAARCGHKVRIAFAVRGLRARWLDMMRNNAEQALKTRQVARSSIEAGLDDMREAFNLDGPPARMECFDISHTGGTDTVASCVVFGAEGPLKNDGEVTAPDVLLIDGGKGQLSEAAKALDELGVSGVTLIGVAKGADRRPGQEQLFLLGQETPTILPPDSSALHLIQRVRDEAHRFAIAGHRRKRAKRHNQSILESIPGLGPVKRRELLKQFGGLQGILRAGIDDFAQVRGLGRELAQVIYEHLHPGQ